ncbi:hypothetical protein JCM24511_00782 [Saitozyma sp. JCM 24511]|nr:hypothetical protein JCM24511_00782 [Saitozyma sp. JCM 24511]
MHVTGFRDPFLAPWTAMDALRQSKPTLYGLISGGIHDSGPRTFLYAVDPTNLASWTYLHPLVEDIPPNFVPSEKWAGDFGVNWECTGFVTLTDDRGHVRECVVSGAEGGMERPWVTKYHASRPKAARRTPRYQNWCFGRLGKRDDEQVRLSVEMAGLVDWGIFYAASLLVAEDGRNMLWGWIIEEDLDEAELARKGWTGCLGLPREIFLATITGVVGALASPLESIGSVELEKDSDGSNTVITFGHRPIREFTALRGQTLFDLPPGPLQPMVSCLQSAPMAYEIQAVMGISDDTDSISFYLRHDDDMSIHTSIVFRPKDETITIDRSHSTNRQDINVSPEVGSHTLFRIQHTSPPQGVLEPLRLRVFLDHDLIEVFANDRFALSTRVYTDKEARGLSLGVQGKATVEELRAWKIGELG